MTDEREMRQVYTEKLIELAEKDDSICVLEADLMKSTGTAPFFEKFPERSFDVGIAEANMIGVAAGLASCGKKPFCASFTPFITRRCFDQIAISVCYSNLNVKLIGTDPSIMAEINGGTHMSMEDIGIMRSLANMVIFEPCDSAMLSASMEQVVNYNGPLYLRLFRKKAEKVFDKIENFDLFKGIEISKGKDCTISVGVSEIHTIKPIDKDIIISAAKRSGAIVTAENHSIYNGLSSAVSEVLSENFPVPLTRVGINDRFGEVGKAAYLSEVFHITENDICEAVRTCIKKKKVKK